MVPSPTSSSAVSGYHLDDPINVDDNDNDSETTIGRLGRNKALSRGAVSLSNSLTEFKMKFRRLHEATKSWTRKIKRIGSRESRKSPQPDPQEDDHPKSSTSDESVVNQILLDVPAPIELLKQTSENPNAPEIDFSELPFHEETFVYEPEENLNSKFEPFPRLPIELRNKIWKHAAFLPRNLEVKSWNYGRRIAIPTLDTNEENPWQVWIYRSNTVPPAILSVNLESRTMGLKYYKLDFGGHYAFRGFTFSTPATIYVNYESDRIVMTQRFHSRDIEDCVDFQNRCFAKARFIALNVKAKGTREECDYIRPFLKKCVEDHADSRLEDIILFSKRHSTNWPGKHVDFKRPPKGWMKSEDDCLVVLKGTRSWVNNSLLKRKDPTSKDELKGPPEIHFGRHSQSLIRY